jgi:riboflavin kinase/FMN adenylyltransferase
MLAMAGIRHSHLRATDREVWYLWAKKQLGDKVFRNLGQTRTCGEEFPLLIEAHLLIENVGDLVGKYMAMDFVQRIRSQQKFKTPEDLSKQIAQDCEKAKEILSTGEGG